MKVRINFQEGGEIIFTVDSEDRQWFDNALEKIDTVLEMLPYHLDPDRIPKEFLRSSTGLTQDCQMASTHCGIIIPK